ncbi:ABC transporter ATP-binding protein [Aquitalea pelogenes]|uniref:ABC transporter ATP-binding protein n=1 Tax=Aquitalea pelogenes TaxID=1293573 RepID=UPI0035AF8B5C
MASDIPLFKLEGVEKEYRVGSQHIRALRGVDLQIERGDYMVIWGPSGSGKSTLLNILGLIDTPTAGILTFDGRQIEALSDNDLSDWRSRKIGFVFQNFNLLPVLTALEHVMLPLQVQGMPVRPAKEKALGILDKLGLMAFCTLRPDHLSGGQKQRVAIARALVADPLLLIADEPTANLDSNTSHEVINLIESINLEMKTSCIFTTHDPRLLDRVSRKLRLVDGVVSDS